MPFKPRSEQATLPDGSKAMIDLKSHSVVNHWADKVAVKLANGSYVHCGVKWEEPEDE